MNSSNNRLWNDTSMNNQPEGMSGVEDLSSSMGTEFFDNFNESLLNDSVVQDILSSSSFISDFEGKYVTTVDNFIIDV